MYDCAFKIWLTLRLPWSPRVPGAMQRVALAQRCFAEPGPIFSSAASKHGPRLCSAPLRKRYALRCVRGTQNKKRRDFSPPFRYPVERASRHCSSFSTLCCDWLASASAETAIDCRVDSAWLLAASSLVSASVRLAEPVCSTLIRFLLKSWRICTTDRLEPSVEASSA